MLPQQFCRVAACAGPAGEPRWGRRTCRQWAQGGGGSRCCCWPVSPHCGRAPRPGKCLGSQWTWTQPAAWPQALLRPAACSPAAVQPARCRGRPAAHPTWGPLAACGACSTCNNVIGRPAGQVHRGVPSTPWPTCGYRWGTPPAIASCTCQRWHCPGAAQHGRSTEPGARGEGACLMLGMSGGWGGQHQHRARVPEASCLEVVRAGRGGRGGGRGGGGRQEDRLQPSREGPRTHHALPAASTQPWLGSAAKHAARQHTCRRLQLA